VKEIYAKFVDGTGEISVTIDVQHDREGEPFPKPDGYGGPYEVEDEFGAGEHDMAYYRLKNGRLAVDGAVKAAHRAKLAETERGDRMRRQAETQLMEMQAVAAVQGATDEEVLTLAPLLPEWEPKRYEAGAIIQYGGEPYKCIQAHDATGNPGWTPDETKSLWKGYRAAVEEWPEFVQPTGGHDAYRKGDRVLFGGARYESLIDGNVWSPTTYPQGWAKRD